MILLIGNKGSMGKRYETILKYHNQDFTGVDIEARPADVMDLARDAERIIVATPTKTHLKILRSLFALEKPILCEKPLATNMEDVDQILSMTSKYRASFNMVLQYSELVDPLLSGPTEYDYFRHGNDGLAWDCLQIIALAKESIKLKETSPVWKCRINGQRLSLSDMDIAYVNFVDKWINDSLNQKTEWLRAIHKKTEDFARELRSKYN